MTLRMRENTMMPTPTMPTAPISELMSLPIQFSEMLNVSPKKGMTGSAEANKLKIPIAMFLRS